MAKTVAITGGIGAGKSVVCRIVRSMGFKVYDCDSEARLLMNGDEDIKRRIVSEVCADAIDPDGNICRRRLSQCVFSDHNKLLKLNEIVHGAVRMHFTCWVNAHRDALRFVETAILRESGFDSLVDEVWEVTAPHNTRIERVMKRSNLSAPDVESRINSQATDRIPGSRLIINDGVCAVIPQLLQLLQND